MKSLNSNGLESQHSDTANDVKRLLYSVKFWYMKSVN